MLPDGSPFLNFFFLFLDFFIFILAECQRHSAMRLSPVVLLSLPEMETRAVPASSGGNAWFMGCSVALPWAASWAAERRVEAWGREIVQQQSLPARYILERYIGSEHSDLMIFR